MIYIISSLIILLFILICLLVYKIHQTNEKYKNIILNIITDIDRYLNILYSVSVELKTEHFLLDNSAEKLISSLTNKHDIILTSLTEYKKELQNIRRLSNDF